MMSAALAEEMQENVPDEEQHPIENTVENVPTVSYEQLILSDSQEQLILNESNFNIQNATSSTSMQQFHFHGPVNFYNK